MSKLRVLDLFSGIGGFSLGLERTGGFRTVAFCEIEEFPRRVLAKHWPDVPIYDDVRTLTHERLSQDGVAVDVICGGFPCQDISFAGKGAGLAGERSGLWREFARLIDEIRPRYALVENVAALLYRGLGEVLGDLAEIGYDAEWHCIPASAVGAPHRRDRIWIVAYPVADAGGGRCSRPDGRQIQQPWRAEAVGTSQVLADANGAGLEGRPRLAEHLAKQLAAIERGGAGQAMGDPARELPYRSRSISEQAGWREPSDASWWLAEPDVGRVAHGVPSRVDRLRALGNAVVPQIPELIGRAILVAEGREAA